MRKISSTILIAVFSLAVTTSLVIGGLIFLNSSRYIKKETESRLAFMSRSYSDSFEKQFYSVESIINTIRAYVETSFDAEEFGKDSSYFREFEIKADQFFRNIARDNSGFEGVYLTFNADLFGDFHEIWYLRLGEDSPPVRVDNELYNLFSEAPATGDDVYPNISQFSEENPAMYYYFEALRRGRGGWDEPAEEVGLPITIVSYTLPVYTDNLLIGVIGIDINIEHLKNTIAELELLNDGYASLLNSNLDVIIHPDYPEHTKLSEADPETWTVLSRFISDKKLSRPVLYESGGRLLSCSSLSNGWIFLLSISEKEIFKPLEDLLFTFIVIAVLISAFSFLAALIFSNRISNPMELAAEQLKNLEEGDLSMQLPDSILHRKDEIGSVVKSVDAVSELIREEVEKNRRKDAVLMYQSRLAKTGEMIAHIAHQWRQPLNSLNLIISNTEEEYRDGINSNPELGDAVQKCRTIIRQMSGTIDDFRFFLHPESRYELFPVQTSICFVTDMLQDSLKSLKIIAETSFEKDQKIFGPANEFTQVLLNILYNARDALSEHRGERHILISTETIKNKAVIRIANNGPAITEDTEMKLFEPYFTTKGNDKGTGIGLYMSKIIIENHFGGGISLENTPDGVECIIQIPLTEESVR